MVALASHMQGAGVGRFLPFESLKMRIVPAASKKRPLQGSPSPNSSSPRLTCLRLTRAMKGAHLLLRQARKECGLPQNRFRILGHLPRSLLPQTRMEPSPGSRTRIGVASLGASYASPCSDCDSTTGQVSFDPRSKKAPSLVTSSLSDTAGRPPTIMKRRTALV